MSADDLSKPLGQGPAKRRRQWPVTPSKVLVVALSGFLGIFAVWALISDNPFGGEPMVAVPVDLHAAMVPKKLEPGQAADAQGSDRRNPGPAVHPVDLAPAPPIPEGGANTRTVTIIDGKTGTRQDVVIPVGPTGAVSERPEAEQKFAEMTPRGLVPKIAADGTRPADAYARPVDPIPGKPDAPRVAIIVGGLGISTSLTADAMAKLPGAVTLAFTPYGAEIDRQVARARAVGHEVLLQVPMEPHGYPDNDPGPQTLLTSLTPEQNIDRLYWLMSRFQGYVGIVGTMGARFTASESAFGPVLRETARRGLIFVDDGSNPRSIATRIAGASSLAFVKADATIDAVPTPVEIEHALGRLEMAARERGTAVGVASALPVSIEQIAKWAKSAESRGVLVVPITAVAMKSKPS